MKFLTADSLSRLLQKIKTVFATKTEVSAAVESADSECVHLTGSETIAGTKTFTSTIAGSVNGSSASCTGNAATATKATQDGSGNTITSTYVNLTGSQTISGAKYYTVDYFRKDTGAVKGTAPSANRWQNGVRFVDNNNVAFGGVERGFLPDGTNRINMIVYKGTTTDTSTNSQIGVGFDGSGNWFTYAPTPATADNSTKIATTAFVKAQGYLTSQTQLSLTNSGSGNAVTGISVSNHAITVTKGSTFLTSHQSLSNYLQLSGGNLTGRCKITGNNFGWQVTNGTETIEFMIGSGKVNRGFWDTKLNKWAVYANDSEVILNGRATGTSSDRRIKQDFSQIPDAVLDAWDSVQWKQFRLRREAASDGAPFHTGAVVQDIQESLQKSGVNPEEYALAYREQIPAEEGDRPSEDNPEIMNSEKWYLRYEEAYAIEAAYLRRRCRMLEKSLADALDRISRIESRLEGD